MLQQREVGTGVADVVVALVAESLAQTLELVARRQVGACRRWPARLRTGPGDRQSARPAADPLPWPDKACGPRLAPLPDIRSRSGCRADAATSSETRAPTSAFTAALPRSSQSGNCSAASGRLRTSNSSESISVSLLTRVPSRSTQSGRRDTSGANCSTDDWFKESLPWFWLRKPSEPSRNERALRGSSHQCGRE